MNEKGPVAAATSLTQSAQESADEFYERVVLAMDGKNFHTSDQTKETETYRSQFGTDTYINLWGQIAGGHSKIGIRVPNPTTEVIGLHTAACNAKREMQNDKVPKFLNKVASTQESSESPQPEPSSTPLTNVKELKEAMLSDIQSTKSSLSHLLFAGDASCSMSCSCCLPPNFQGWGHGHSYNHGKGQDHDSFKGNGFQSGFPHTWGQGQMPQGLFELSPVLTASTQNHSHPHDFQHHT